MGPLVLAPGAAFQTYAQTHTQILRVRGKECQLLALSVLAVSYSLGVQMIHVLLIQQRE